MVAKFALEKKYLLKAFQMSFKPFQCTIISRHKSYMCGNLDAKDWACNNLKLNNQ